MAELSRNRRRRLAEYNRRVGRIQRMLIRAGFHQGPLAFSTKSSPPELTAAYYRRGRHEVVRMVRMHHTAEWSYKADNDAAAVEGRGIEALAQLIADEDWDGGHVRMTLLLAGA